MHENDCEDLRAGVHTADENGLDVNVASANEEVDIDIILENVRKGIAVGLSVLVVGSVDAVHD